MIIARNGLTQAQVIEYEKELIERDKESYKFLMNDPRGRWLLSRLKEFSFFESHLFTGNSTTFFNDGKRMAIMDLVQNIELTSIELAKKVIDAKVEELELKENLARSIKNRIRDDEED